VRIYKNSKLTPKDMILAELKKILVMAQDKAREDDLDTNLYDFLMNVDVAIGETSPAMALRVQTTMLRGQDVATFISTAMDCSMHGRVDISKLLLCPWK
jgi:hypothetical protein